MGKMHSDACLPGKKAGFLKIRLFLGFPPKEGLGEEGKRGKGKDDRRGETEDG